MFRQEKAFLPFNEISHLTGESLGFALNLRKQHEIKNKAQQKMATAPAAEKIMPAVDTKNDPDGFAVKETNCVNTRCLKNNLIYAEEFHERLDLLSRLEELCATLEQQEEALSECSVLYDAALKIHHDATEKMTELTKKEVQLKIEKTRCCRDQIKLDQELRKAEKQKEQLIQGKEASQQSVGANFDIIFHANRKPNQACMKHNGLYILNKDGVYAWTCCNAQDHDHAGCMDDHSVGVRSTLPMVKNYYSNQLNINHPLQHGSSLFLENTVKVHKVQQQQHVAGEGVTGLKNNDSLFEGSYYDNKLPLARGSSIDYFSVHKPASRVLAMEPHSNRSIRTTSGLQFGVPPTSRPASSSATAGANTILGFSQSQSQSQVQDRVRPTTAPLQRANITEMYPHLDAKIRKQQVEQRYVAVDYTKPLSENPSDRTSSLHHGTKLYSQYSRPYAHTNTNTQGHGYGHGHGLFTHSIHTHSHSQSHSHSQLLRPYTAGPGGHNASMVSNVSWGQSVYLGESGDSGDPAAAPAVAVASSRSGDANSRDDDEGDAREINFAPRASSSTDSRQNQQSHQASKASQELPGKAASSSVCSPNPTPRYAQPKSLSLPTGHKAMIGKQVAVPERVKLRRNRPLTSPDGYNLYSS